MSKKIVQKCVLDNSEQILFLVLNVPIHSTWTGKIVHQISEIWTEICLGDFDQLFFESPLPHVDRKRKFSLNVNIFL